MTDLGELKNIDVKGGKGNQSLVVIIEGEDGDASVKVSDSSKGQELSNAGADIVRRFNPP